MPFDIDTALEELAPPKPTTKPVQAADDSGLDAAISELSASQPDDAATVPTETGTPFDIDGALKELSAATVPPVNPARAAVLAQHGIRYDATRGSFTDAGKPLPGGPAGSAASVSPSTAPAPAATAPLPVEYDATRGQWGDRTPPPAVGPRAYHPIQPVAQSQTAQGMSVEDSAQSVITQLSGSMAAIVGGLMDTESILEKYNPLTAVARQVRDRIAPGMSAKETQARESARSTLSQMTENAAAERDRVADDLAKAGVRPELGYRLSSHMADMAIQLIPQVAAAGAIPGKAATWAVRTMLEAGKFGAAAAAVIPGTAVEKAKAAGGAMLFMVVGGAIGKMGMTATKTKLASIVGNVAADAMLGGYTNANEQARQTIERRGGNWAQMDKMDRTAAIVSAWAPGLATAAGFGLMARPEPRGPSVPTGRTFPDGPKAFSVESVIADALSEHSRSPKPGVPIETVVTDALREAADSLPPVSRSTVQEIITPERGTAPAGTEVDAAAQRFNDYQAAQAEAQRSAQDRQARAGKATLTAVPGETAPAVVPRTGATLAKLAKDIDMPENDVARLPKAVQERALNDPEYARQVSAAYLAARRAGLPPPVMTAPEGVPVDQGGVPRGVAPVDEVGPPKPPPPASPTPDHPNVTAAKALEAAAKAMRETIAPVSPVEASTRRPFAMPQDAGRDAALSTPVDASGRPLVIPTQRPVVPETPPAAPVAPAKAESPAAGTVAPVVAAEAPVTPVAPAPEPVAVTKPAPAPVKVEAAPGGDVTVSVPSKDKPGITPSQQKKYLAAEVDKAIEQAPDDPVESGRWTADHEAQLSQAEAEADTARKAFTERVPGATEMAWVQAANRRQDLKNQRILNQHNTVTIEVPGDGTFEVVNSKAALREFKTRIKRFPISNSNEATRTSPKPSGVVKVSSVRPSKQADVEAALDPMKSADDTREILMQSHVDAKSRTMVATDGRRLAAILDVPFPASTHQIHETVTDKNGTTRTGKMVPGTFPNYEQIIPGYRRGKVPKPDFTGEHAGRAEVDTEELSRKLDQAIAVTKEMPMGKRDLGNNNPTVALYQMPDGSIAVSATHPDTGGYESAEVARGKFATTVSAEYLRDAMTFLRKMGNQKARIEWQDKLSPIVISGKSEYQILMPMNTEASGAKLRSVETLPPAAQPPKPAAQPTPAPGKAEGGEIIGMGGAVTSEFTALPSSTGIKRRSVDAQRAARGLPPLEPPPPETNQAQWEEAISRIDADWQVGEKLEAQIRAKPRTLTPVENFILMQRETDILNERRKTERDIVQAHEDGRTGEIDGLKAIRDKWSDEATKLEEVVAAAGTEWGRAGQARQRTMAQDYTLEAMETRLRAAKDGARLTPEERSQVEELSKRYAETKAKADADIARLQAEAKAKDDIIAKSKGNIEFEKLVDQVIAELSKPRTFSRELIAKGQARMDAAAARMQARMKRASSNPFDPSVLVDMVDYGYGLILKGSGEFGVWAGKMRQAFKGTDIESELKSAYMKANLEVLRDAGIKAPRAKKPTGTPKDGEPAPEEIGTDPASIKQLFRDQVDAGVRTLDEAVKNVHEIVSEVAPDMSPEQVRDAFSDYGKTKQPNPQEEAKVMADLRRQAQLVASIERVANELAPLKTGLQRDKPSQKARELQRKLNAMMKEAGIETVDPATQLATAMQARKTNLENQIADLDKAIATRQRMVTNKEIMPDDAETAALRATRDARRAVYDAMFPKIPITDAQRLAAAIKASERALVELQKCRVDAAKGIFGKPTAASQPWSAALSAIKVQQKAMRKEIADLQELANPRRTPEQMAIDAKRKRLDAATAEMKRRMAEKDFAPRAVNQVDISGDPAALASKVANEMVREQFDRMKARVEWDQMTKMGKAIRTAGNLWDSARLLMTTGEMSFLLRQGKWYVMSHPIAAAKALPDTFRALVASNEHARAIDLKTHEDPLAEKARAAKLALMKEGVSVTRDEEIVAGRWGEVIPVVSNFNNAARVFLNRIRLNEFKALRKTMSRSRTPTPEEDKLFAKMANEMTGRGGMGKLEPAAFVAGRIMFAPRYLMSRIQLAVGHSVWSGLGKSPKVSARARGIIAMEYARMLIGWGLYNSALYAYFNRDDKAEYQTDSRSTDWTKIKKNETRVDTMAGIAQVIVFASRTAMLSKMTTKGEIVPLHGTKENPIPFGGDKWSDVANSFAWSKAHPIPASIKNLFDGTDLAGQEVTLERQAGQVLAPMTYVDIYKALKENDIEDGAAFALLAFLGEGIQTYKSNHKPTAMQKRRDANTFEEFGSFGSFK